MRSQNKQRGIGLIGLMTLIAIGGFAVYTVFALMPIYSEYLQVRSSVDSLNEGAPETDLNTRRLQDLLQRRFMVNSITHVGPHDITITPAQGYFRVVVAYEVRIPWFANIDLVTKFQHETQVRRP
ncbi:MAG: DUF4845 domain-containing protein [Pseudomonadota bacterium]